MLSITPIPAKPSKVIADVVRMFSAECLVNDISISIIGDSSNEHLTQQPMLVDTSRLAQILINLLSNATKFVVNQHVRKITVTYGASLAHPPIFDTAFPMNSIEDEGEDPSNDALPDLHNDEERLYLYFVVTDSGPGMTDEEMSRLFKRFSQATARTHIQYGGSGIGLYVCRQLAGKQGGRICVGSRLGVGTSFGFYIESRLVEGIASAVSNGPATSGRLGLSRDQGYSRSDEVTSTADVLLAKRASDMRQQMRGFDLFLVEDVSKITYHKSFSSR